MKIRILLLCVIVLVSSCMHQNNHDVEKQHKWSEIVTNSVTRRWDTIAADNKYKWTYDIAYLVRAVYLSDQKKYFSFLKNYVDYFITNNGTITGFSRDEYNLDRIQAGRNLFYMYQKTKDSKYQKAIEYLLEQMKSQPKNNEGGFWHKKIYPNQMWLDGIYMACPFMAQYAKEFNQPQWFNVVVDQITLIHKHTFDPKTGLMYHAWDESKKEAWCNPETGQSRNFWSRAMGWYTMALIDVLDYLPENHPGRAQLIQILQEESRALVKVQDSESGLWYQVLDKGYKEGNYLEASGSAMFTYVLAKGVRKGYLDKSYLDIANKAFKGIVDNLIEKDTAGNLNLTHICGSCGLGGNPYRDGSYEYYINEKIGTNDPKGVGPFILACLELNK
ncbi:MAG TPA: glycoside hydrolase family 88 protein [Bacteroidales bacterium]